MSDPVEGTVGRPYEDGHALRGTLEAIGSLVREFPGDIIVIGGLGVFLHARNRPMGAFDRTSDVDFSIFRAAFATLRDLEEVLNVPRSRK